MQTMSCVGVLCVWLCFRLQENERQFEPRIDDPTDSGMDVMISFSKCFAMVMTARSAHLVTKQCTIRTRNENILHRIGDLGEFYVHG